MICPKSNIYKLAVTDFVALEAHGSGIKGNFHIRNAHSTDLSYCPWWSRCECDTWQKTSFSEERRSLDWCCCCKYLELLHWSFRMLLKSFWPSNRTLWLFQVKSCQETFRAAVSPQVSRGHCHYLRHSSPTYPSRLKMFKSRKHFPFHSQLNNLMFTLGNQWNLCQLHALTVAQVRKALPETSLIYFLLPCPSSPKKLLTAKHQRLSTWKGKCFLKCK